MLQRSIHSVFGVTWNGCYKLQRNTWKRRRSWKTILSRLWNYCACHAKRGRVTFAPTLGSHSPLPPRWVGASATPHEVGANATPVPVPSAESVTSTVLKGVRPEISGSNSVKRLTCYTISIHFDPSLFAQVCQNLGFILFAPMELWCIWTQRC